MKVGRKTFYQVSVIFMIVIAGILISLLIWRQRTSQPLLIGREQAIQNAIQACNPVYGLQPVEQPTEFETEITTYEKALGFEPSHPLAQRPVWVVKMKGHWLLVGGPQRDPASNPEPAYWDECTQIIDAQTGEWLSLPIE